MSTKVLAFLVFAGLVLGCLPARAGQSEDPLLTRLRQVSADLEYVRERKAEILAELALCELESARLTWQLAWRRQQLAALVRVLYEMGPVGPLDILLGARDLSDLLFRADMLLELTGRVANLVSEIERAAADLDHRRAELEALRERLEAAEGSLASRQEELRSRVLALAALSGQFGRMIAAQQACWGMPARELRMAVPVGGVVTSGYGPRVHPVAGVPEFHAGVDVAAPEGAPVRVAERGLVVVAGRVGDYGNVVVVDHGGGVATVYAHLSRCLAVPGQRVVRGAVVGLVGSTGLSTGPHLHFEVRVWGRPEDPAGWLRSDKWEGSAE
ncbi:MAG: M23 family metallopeptidase [Bacillota bacterium]